MKIITENKQARFEYFVEETYKTGIVLEGAEVKSIRAGNINLLLRRSEINKIVGKVSEKGYTLIPLNAFFEGSLVKITVGLCKGKHTFDKKETIKQRDLDRQAQREINNYK